MGTFSGNCETLSGFLDSSSTEPRRCGPALPARLMPLLAWICDDANFMVHYVITPFPDTKPGRQKPQIVFQLLYSFLDKPPVSCEL